MFIAILLGAAIAAHPLTPFSADQLVELTLHQDRIDVSVWGVSP